MKRFSLFICSILLFNFSCKKGEVQQNVSQQTKKNDIFLIPFQVGKNWGLADTLGNIKVKPQYDELVNFEINSERTFPTSSYYLMRKGDEIHFIDSDNKRYFKNFEIIQDADKNIFYKKNNRMGFAYPSFSNGEWQIDENPASYPYDKITKLKDDLFFYSIVKIANKTGLLKYENETVIPVKYDSLDYSVKNNTAFFKAYHLNEKKIVKTETFTIDLTAPPPPSVIQKKPYEEWLKTEKVPAGESYAALKDYKNIFRVKETLSPIIVKDNKSNQYAIFEAYSEKPLEFKYDLVLPGLDRTYSNESQKLFIVKKDNKFALFAPTYNKESDWYDFIEQRTFYNQYGNFIPYIVAKKDGKFGMIVFDTEKKAFKESIPFQFDDIIDGNIVVKDNLFGVYNSGRNTVKILPIYKTKPEVYKRISYNGDKYQIYQAVNKNDKKILILSNGLELYRD